VQIWDSSNSNLVGKSNESIQHDTNEMKSRKNNLKIKNSIEKWEKD
jgi:hypothetical protein